MVFASHCHQILALTETKQIIAIVVEPIVVVVEIVARVLKVGDVLDTVIEQIFKKIFKGICSKIRYRPP